jgi:hypothetical protein
MKKKSLLTPVEKKVMLKLLERARAAKRKKAAEKKKTA